MNIDWMELVNDLVEVVFNFAVVVLLPLAFAWIKAQVAKAKAQISKEQLEVVEIVVYNAVKTAEQLGIVAAVESKKDLAIAVAEKELAEYGIEIDLDILSDKVEAAVNDLFPKYD